MAPLVELRGTFPITLTGNNDVKIGEFDLAITSSFGSRTTQPNSNANFEQLISNEDSFEMNEQTAQQLANETNQRIHEQMAVDNRIPTSLQNRGADTAQYAASNFGSELG